MVQLQANEVNAYNAPQRLIEKNNLTRRNYHA